MPIVLYQPQIPQNTGNIVRTCAVTGTALLLVPPFGFSLADRWLKRAGLDYWEGVNVQIVEDLEQALASLPHQFYFFSSKAEKLYTENHYTPDDWLIFGSETSGLPSHFHQTYHSHFARIPQIEGSRCLNLATSCGIVLFEALRQGGFPKLIVRR